MRSSWDGYETLVETLKKMSYKNLIKKIVGIFNGIYLVRFSIYFICYNIHTYIYIYLSNGRFYFPELFF